jgi:hypothetical protein
MTEIVRTDVERDGFDAAMADVAQLLAAGVRPIGPSELTQLRARRRLLRVVSASGSSEHHDQPAA